MGLLAEIAGSFVLGLLTPLTAVCVIPLYPGFITYLTRQFDEDVDRRTYALFGVAVGAGVLAFMAVVGIVFTTLLQVSLTAVTGVVSPVAFGVLAVVGVLLVLGIDPAEMLPTAQAPTTGRPMVDAFGFGFFFGAIVLPCNPAFIAVFFARAFLFTTPAISLLNFLAFGAGIAAPLVLFAVASARWSREVISVLTRNRRAINVGSGLVMVGVALYYLVVVFEVVPV